MANHTRLFLRGPAIIVFLLIATYALAQPGAQPLRSLEWANFGTGTGDGYVVYTPGTDGMPVYYKFADILNDLGVVGTDDQVLSVNYDNVNKILSGTLEDGGAFSISLFDLEDRLELVGNTLRIIGNPGVGIDLSQYLDNTDDQVIETFTYSGGILTLKLENSSSVQVNISEMELDPIFVASAAFGITAQQIAAWDLHLIQDQDLDPTNEFDSTTVTKTNSDELTFSGATTQGPKKVVWVTQGFITGGDNPGGGTPQVLDLTNNLLSLSDGGGQVDLSIYLNSNALCQEVTGVTTSTISSPVTLPGDANKRQIFLNGIMMTEKTTMTHLQHVNIVGQNINFYENLSSNFHIRVCTQ